MWLNGHMKVWVAAWEVGLTQSGFELFDERDLAVEAVIDYAHEMSMLDDDGTSEEDARAMLTSTGQLNFEDRQCYYSVRSEEVVSRMQNPRN
jgi:hypothetical protein